MKAVFADTLYWVAIVKPNDSWGELAKQAKSSLGNVRILTTDEVLTEFLATLSSGGEKLRLLAVKMVRAILDNPNVKVLPQSRASFLRGVEFYEERLDKKYSLVDCISMNSMRQENLSDILTNDNHFVQEGFNILIRQNK